MDWTGNQHKSFQQINTSKQASGCSFSSKQWKHMTIVNDNMILFESCGNSQINHEYFVQEILFSNQSLVFGCLVPCSYSTYSKATSYYKNHCPSFYYILMESAMKKNEPFILLKISLQKESKGISILLTAVRSLFSYCIYS